jgi:hypothetical protein
MEKIIWTYHVRNEQVLLGVKEQRNILHEISKRNANWIDIITMDRLTQQCICQQVVLYTNTYGRHVSV